MKNNLLHRDNGIVLSSPGDSSYSLTEPTTSAHFTRIKESREALQAELIKSLAEALYMNSSDIDVEKAFIDMGLDSIVAVEWIQSLNKEHGLSILATKVYDYPNILSFTEFLLKELKIGKRALSESADNKRPVISTEIESQRERMPSFLQLTPLKKKRFFRQDQNRSPSCDDEDSASSPPHEPIAIIGMSGRYPGASDLSEYWTNLIQAKNCIQEVPEGRWDTRFYYDSDPSKTGKVYCKWIGLLDDIDCFDPLFFAISPAEAEMMDPQHRIFLEEGYKTFEQAGYTRHALSEINCGVYLGIMSHEYSLLSMQHQTALSGTSNSFAIGAARIPYFLNLKGPAIPIDTACSSSLVATHLACQALAHGEIDMALVGGVTLYFTAESYIGMSAAGMLSPEGQCKTFDDDADGFVPGEGVGAMVLKTLSQAQKDNDYILGTIIGSGINQDGKTNGITAPSVMSQIQLERGIYDRYKIDPASISYVETHGTGTKLGDPIELEALSTVFKEKTDQKNFCGLGSVKTNIGHTSAAAGVASIHKILLSLRHKKLVPSLNFEKPNRHFDFEDSPFYVNTELRPWNSEQSPRRAAISSFGFSGTNAHMVIEEYVEKGSGFSIQGSVLGKGVPAVIVLSARNKERLKEYAKKLLKYVSRHLTPDTSLLSDLAYTLQVGREAMEERLGIIVHSMKELEENLQDFIGGNEPITNLYLGQSKRKKDSLAASAADEDMAKMIEAWIRKKKYNKLLDLWVKGLIVDWDKLYNDTKPQRIGAPTYPFARERYWLSASSNQLSVVGNQLSEIIHPLLHKNTSNLSGQRFSSIFTGEEFFLKDHEVKGQKILPGVACLEMAREAVEKAVEDLSHDSWSIQLKNVVWIRPIALGGKPLEVHIGLFPKENGEIAFEIYTDKAHSEEESLDELSEPSRRVHSQGVAILSTPSKKSPINLADLQEKLNKTRLSDKDCYEALKRVGVDYGPSYQGLDMIFVGDHELLAKLQLPASVSETKEQFTLHPSLLDSALQASIGLNIVNCEPGTVNPEPSLPFAADSIEIIDACTESMWAWLQVSNAGTPSNKVQKLDVDLCDEEGNVCVRMRGLSSRVLEAEQPDTLETIGTLLLKPVLREKPLDPEHTRSKIPDHRVVLCGFNQYRHQLAKSNSDLSLTYLESNQTSLGKRFRDYSLALFENIQNILQEKTNAAVLIQVLVPAQGNDHVFSGLSGLLKTAHLENPRIFGQVIALEENERTEDLLVKLTENGKMPEDSRIHYDGDKRLVYTFEEVAGSTTEQNFPWKDSGVYLITGGAGGLGFLFAKEIATKINNAKLILTGRSILNSKKKAKLKELENLGATVVYKAVDVSDKEAVKILVREIQKDYGELNGLIHSAGVTNDNFIIKKNKEEFAEVLTPKVDGIINLDHATKDLEHLDFFILFSSGAGVMGNAGQADYSTANGFMDAFANGRYALCKLNERRGKTLSINWPLWRDGGMGIDNASEKIMEDNQGLVPMETVSGLAAFYQSVSSNEPQVMVVEGDLKKLYTLFLDGVRIHFVSGGRDVLGSGQSNAVIPGCALPTQPLNHRFSPALRGAELLFTTHKMNTDSLDEGAHHIEPQDRKNQGAGATVIEEKIDEEALKEKAVNYFKRQLSKVLKLSSKRIQAEEPLEKYGIDSIMVMQLTNELEKTFGSLSKTLFFEYQTIQEISHFFLDAYRLKFVKLLHIKETNRAVPEFEKSVHKTLPLQKYSPQLHRSRIEYDISKSLHPSKETALDIAIIGLSGRYPQSNNLEEYWQNLQSGRDCITEVPIERWDWREYYSEDHSLPGNHDSKWGGFIADVDKFDPLFFNISPRDAKTIDPQERLFLEHVWMALEDAGYRREDLQGDTGEYLGGQVGVYAGVMYGDYQLFGAEKNVRGNSILYGGSYASIANRVSYVLNLHGPSMTVDTMCSSSLTTLHLGCQDLKLGRINLAIAGGVNVSIHPNKYLGLSMGKFISSRGRCESFGAEGEGYIPGEGVGIVLLKRLSDATKDGDHIYGVIKGSAVNHGGKTNGYTVPNPNAQMDVISRALKESNIDPRSVSYVEAHGTGTKLGDPIEITGLSKAFGLNGTTQSCWIGSAKSNIGHCESAAGIAGVTKVLLQMKYGKIAPSLHSGVLNQNIDFATIPFVVNQELRDWKKPIIEGTEYPRIAGISSFGAGGSNAHVLIEEYVEKGSGFRVQGSELGKGKGIGKGKGKSALIVLSARNKERLKEYAKKLLKYVSRHLTPDTSLLSDNSPQTTDHSTQATDNRSRPPRRVVNHGKSSTLTTDHCSLTPDTSLLSDLAYTLQVGREAMEERLGMVVHSMEELEEKLRGFIAGDEDMEDLYFGQVKRNKDTLAVFAADEDLQKAIDAWIVKGKYNKLMDLWVKGLMFDWGKLYGDTKPQRISAPTYPFARERYWVETGDSKGTSPTKPDINVRSTPQSHSLATSATSQPLHVLSASTEKITSSEDRLKPTQISLSAPSAVGDFNERNKKKKRSPISVLKNVDVLKDLKAAMPMDVKSAIPTLNRTGVMVEGLISYSEDFASYAGQCGGEVLDIGCAYGVATIAALEQGAQVLAVDMEPQHLDILESRINDDAMRRLRTQQGLLPEINFENERFAAIHASRVIHFLKPEDVQETIKKMYQWLQPGGKLFLITDTPYVGYWASKASDYEARKASGELWPGYIEDVSKYFDDKDIRGGPSLINPLDPDILKRECSVVGFNVENVGFLANGSTFEEGSNRAYAGVLAVKPLSSSRHENQQSHESSEDIQKILKMLLAEELSMDIDQVDDEMPFIDMGLDSISAVAWVRKINTHYGLSINTTKVYNHSTIVEFGKYIKKKGKDRGLFQYSKKASSIAETSPEHVLDYAREQFQCDRDIAPSLIPQSNGKTEGAPKRVEIIDRTGKDQTQTQSIAVIGMSGQFPKSRNLDEFWDNLVHGLDCISEIPPTRWNLSDYYDPDPLVTGKTYCKWMGALEDMALFDPSFFNISPKEAELMDPQQRLFLQSSWHCIEDAGYNPAQLSGSRCGVFVGCGASDYGRLVESEELSVEGAMGGATSVLSARISYLLNLRGPSLPIDTACSSSLVAIASACDSLVLRNSDSALAGGVCVLVGPAMHIVASNAGMLSSNGRCFTFDQRANGYVLGEGVGVILLKRLEDAERDGDRIHAVIRGWGVNQDGKTNGITAPNPDSQARLEKEIYDKFAINPGGIQLLEAHGAGTKLGDPIEVEGLKESFKSYTTKMNFCALGSVKSNIGHLLTAAGISGFMKLLLSLKYRKIPPTIHYDHLNEHIELEKSPFYVNAECKDWNVSDGQKRCSAISSFGLSGTNAHVVLEEYIEQSSGFRVQGSGLEKDRSHSSNQSDPSYLIVLSAKNKERLEEYAKKLLKYVSRHLTPDHSTQATDNSTQTPDTSLLSDHSPQTTDHSTQATDNCFRHGESSTLITDHSTQTTDHSPQVTDHCSLFTTHLQDLAYTLQVGRAAMEERLGLIVHSMQELAEKLQGFLERKKDTEEFYITGDKQNKKMLAVFAADEDMDGTIETWMSKGKYRKILDLWVNGLNIDWDKLYGDNKPRRISAPTYPFARERYWVQESGHSKTNQQSTAEQCETGSTVRESNEVAITNHNSTVLHPLVPENTSNFSESDPDETSIQEEAEPSFQWNFSLPTEKKELGRHYSAFSREEKTTIFLRQLFADELHKPIDDIETERDYTDMGLTSLSFTKVVQIMKHKLDKDFPLTRFFEYTTVSDLSSHICKRYPVEIDRLIVTKKQVQKTISETEVKSAPSPDKKLQNDLFAYVKSQFPELIRLNERASGRPVFWFHPALGGVQPYYVIAENSERPFCGIQARGWQTDRSPLHGIQAMAAYYVHIIQSVQPQGPYDLGGYSLGGIFSYEVARQLQELGQTINTITMLDTLGLAELKNFESCTKSKMLQVVNTAFAPTMELVKEKMKDSLIHRDELNMGLDDERFLDQLVALARKRGFQKTKSDIQELLSQTPKISKSYDVQNFSLLPLSDPRAIKCYYFRNKSGLFWGEFEPYFTTTKNETAFDRTSYWRDWKKQLPRFHIMDVDSANHMVFLSEPKVCETIIDFCKSLYSNAGMSEQFLKSFKRNVKRKHGTLNVKK